MVTSLEQDRAKLHELESDPILFMTEVLDVKEEFVWDKMREVCESVRDNNRTCVYAGHSVSKSFSAARLAIWFLTTFGPGATVITTAPSNHQVEEILWREIADAYHNSRKKLGGVLTKRKLDMGADLDPPEAKWFALGFATTPDTVSGEATRFQGFHNKHVLVIFDEAAGILSQIWRAAEHLLTSEEAETESISHWRWLAIGNPTSPYGDFAGLEDDPDWHCITISVKDTPNFIEGKLVIPGLSGRRYEERMATKYGRDSNEYKVRILGQKPRFGEGTFYGWFMSEAEKRGHLKESLPIEQITPVHTFWDIGPTNTAVIFVQLVDNWLRVIDGYFDNKGLGWNSHATMIRHRTTGDAKWPYLYGDHWAPHDLWGANAKNMSGELNVELAQRAGLPFLEISEHTFEDRLAATRNIVSTKILFDMSVPGVRMIVDALRKYRQRKDERNSTDERPAYFKDPVKDWTRHVADAFGHMSIVYERDGIRPYLPHVITTVKQSPYAKGDKLGRGLKAIA